MASDAVSGAYRAYCRARERRRPWEALWQDCFDYGMPVRGVANHPLASKAPKSQALFDGTAVDAVEQLGASLLAELTPPWSGWLGLRPGHDVPESLSAEIAAELELAAARINGHFDRSNFAVEIHQCFLDLVTVGTATLLFEEAPIGDSTAFRFAAVSPSDMFVDGGHNGTINNCFRRSLMSRAAVRAKFAAAQNLPNGTASLDQDPTLELIEAVMSLESGYHYIAFLAPSQHTSNEPLLVSEGHFERSPFVIFRWQKGTGELYGRSPVMAALPDIKTANKVVELILKNASIAVTGIWLAEDDGVLNPANIQLVPGSIIPKAVGTAGLTPLQSPGRFDVSQLVLQDFRSRIRHTLLTDRLAPVTDRRMTATEVLERSAEMTRLLGAIFGRLQAELLNPLAERAINVLVRRGEIPSINLDGGAAELHYRSPLARVQSREDVRNTLLWLDGIKNLGEEAVKTVDIERTSHWLATALGVPDQLVRETDPLGDLVQELLDPEIADNE